MKIRDCGSETVVHPEAILASGYKSRTAEIGEMAGNKRLGGVENVHDIAYANLARSEEVENAEPGSVGKGPEHTINGVLRSGFHICLSKYSCGEMDVKKSVS